MAYDFPDAPTPGQVFNQWTWDAATGAWKLTAGDYVKRAGDTMTGFLTLSAPPTAPLHAATKGYADNAAFPAGTVLLFYQAAAPTGWTRVTTQHDKALRVVGSTAGGVAGGTNAFSTVMAQTVTGSTTLSTGNVPSLSVGGTASVSGNMPWTTLGFPLASGGGTNLAYGSGTTALGSSGSISGTASGSGGAHLHTITMAIQYIDIILASKN